MITGINIFILFFVMSYFLFNPAREVLEKRRKRIAGDLETAKTSREDALALKAEYEDKIKSIDKEAQEILDAARKKAKKQEADILAEAREEANRIVDRAFWNGDLREDGGEDAVFQPAFGTAVIQGRGGDDLVSGRLCDRKTSDRFSPGCAPGNGSRDT